METPSLQTSEGILTGWEKLLKFFKERLAKHLWALPTVSEAEKEAVYREYLVDLDDLEANVGKLAEEASRHEHRLREENQILRNLMGLEKDSVRDENLKIGMELASTREDLKEKSSALEETIKEYSQTKDENTHLRKRLKEFEDRAENFRVHELRKREDDIRFFSESQDRLNIQLRDLETRLGNLRSLYTESNQKLLTEKQSEIALVQKSLLDEMETTLKRRMDLVWAEEDLFAKGIAHRVRTALVSAQGQLYLTLERLGLLDPETKNEAFWKSRIQLLMKGAAELGHSFRSITDTLQDVTKTLDDYLHLTGRKSLSKESIDLKGLLERLIAEVYVERRPGLHLEFLSDDPLPFIEGDRELMQFSLKALLQNALEALPTQTGEVAISVKNRGPMGIQILLRDSGQGIPPPLQPKVFQPFFTTKEGRQGLSLNRAKRYVELHGGELSMIQSTEKGTLFQVNIPLTGGLA